MAWPQEVSFQKWASMHYITSTSRASLRKTTIGLTSRWVRVACTISLHKVVDEVLVCLMSEVMSHVPAFKRPQEVLLPDGLGYHALHMVI